MLGNDMDNSIIVSFDRILADGTRQIAFIAGLEYDTLSITERLLLTRFRCPVCGILPLYCLDMKFLNKIRCGKCSMIVGLRNSSGKYGRIRKQIAISVCKTIDETLSVDIVSK
jgi:hypothetical protein